MKLHPEALNLPHEDENGLHKDCNARVYTCGGSERSLTNSVNIRHNVDATTHGAHSNQQRKHEPGLGFRRNIGVGVCHVRAAQSIPIETVNPRQTQTNLYFKTLQAQFKSIYIKNDKVVPIPGIQNPKIIGKFLPPADETTASMKSHQANPNKMPDANPKRALLALSSIIIYYTTQQQYSNDDGSRLPQKK